jgi:mitochondrial fission protein ELM1
MVGVFQALAEQIRSEGGSLLATTSRRTPPALAEILRATFADLPHVIWGDGGDGTNPYGGLLGWANRVVVSPDSVNLLSEACATRMPVMVALADTCRAGWRASSSSCASAGGCRRTGWTGSTTASSHCARPRGWRQK